MARSGRIVVVLLAVFVGITFLGPAASAEQKQIVMRFGHMNNAQDSVHLGALKFAELVAAGTNGRIKIEVFPAGQLGSTTDQFGNVKMGTQEMFAEGLPVASRIQSDFWVLVIPFLMKDHEHGRKIYTGPIVREMTDKLAKEHGIRVLRASWDRGDRYLLTKTPVSKLEDLKGLKIRVPTNPMFVKAWKALGASPTPVEIPEIYMALQQGVIDGLEHPAHIMYSKKYYENAKYCLKTNHLIDFTAIFMNEKIFQGLSPAEQKVLLDAAREAGEYHDKVLRDYLKTVYEKMENEGVKFLDFSPAEKERWTAISAKVGTDLEAEGKWPKGLIARILEANRD